ncbi:MAG: MBL fold metallo-hydrolase [Lachnospiraceae bacterium]|nr:MBL fold metallo-hydrolase [Lachnospiraceae bacterium]
MMQMIRTFNAVGQGAFYTECFENTGNVVYDCGTSSKLIHLEREINSQFEEDEVIAAVFISHLHVDHCNGLDYLLKRCNVKKLFLPYLNEEDTILALLLCALHTGIDSFVWKLIESPLETIAKLSEDTKIVFVTADEAGDRLPEHYTVSMDSIGVSETDEVIISSGTELIFPISSGNWVYVPHHFRTNARIAQMKALLAKKGLAFPKSSEEVINLYQTNKTVLKELYKNELDGKANLNNHTMVVYSGPLHATRETDIWAYPIDLSRRCCNYLCKSCRYFLFPGTCEEMEAGCLYLGDYEVKESAAWRELQNFIDKYKIHIGCVQLPHHGSANNYHVNLKDLCEYFVVTCGYEYRYHHPDARVVRDIVFAGKNLFVVNEAAGSRQSFLIDGWDR